MALALYRPLFWVLLILQIVILLGLAWHLRLRWLPAWLFRVVFIGAILLAAFTPRGDLFREEAPLNQVLIVDQSDSIPIAIRQQMQDAATNWHQAQRNRFVVAYGHDVAVVPAPQATWPEVDGRGSNLVAALAVAVDLLGPRPGQILLASDGIVSNEESMASVLTTLTERGHRLDILPLDNLDMGNDVYVGSLLMPNLVWEGTLFSAVLPVYASVAQEVSVQFAVDGLISSEQRVQLSAGENMIPLLAEAQAEGVMLLEAAVLAATDPRPENNRAFATVQVVSSPNVLYVSDKPSQNRPFAEALQASGIAVDVVMPAALPIDLPRLESYQVIFLDDLPISSLTQEQMMALRVYVSRRGGGVVLLGGRDSYTLGDYQNSILAPMMPVKLAPPDRLERPPTTFVVVFDRSLTMRRAPEGERPPIDLAREAAMRAIEVLNPDDYVGIMTFATDWTWDVPIGPVGGGLALRRAQDAISRVQAGGATSMYQTLAQTIQDIDRLSETNTRLILLLSDGKGGSPRSFQELAQEARQLDIAISTIAFGSDVDLDVMGVIAEESGGRLHVTANADELPRIMVTEGRAARSENRQEGETSLIPGEEGHPVLFGLSPAQLPSITTYNALTSKMEQGAEDILVSASFGDPILSGWQYGLGRVVAWMGDGGDEWAEPWADWPQAPLFWSQVVRYAQPNPVLGPAQVNVEARETELVVELQLQTELDQPLNWAEPRFVYVGEDGRFHTYAVPQTAPGLYTLALPLPAMGSYRGLIQYEYGGETVEVAAPFAVDYPAEWRPGDSDVGRVNLLDWAAATGGGETTLAVVPVEPEPTSLAFWGEEDERLHWLLLALIAFWPLEIAVRRRWLPWQ